jgi:hypothetical protein
MKTVLTNVVVTTFQVAFGVDGVRKETMGNKVVSAD